MKFSLAATTLLAGATFDKITSSTATTTTTTATTTSTSKKHHYHLQLLTSERFHKGLFFSAEMLTSKQHGIYETEKMKSHAIRGSVLRNENSAAPPKSTTTTINNGGGGRGRGGEEEVYEEWCDPTADTGILACGGNGRYCIESHSNSLGGICVDDENMIIHEEEPSNNGQRRVQVQGVAERFLPILKSSASSGDCSINSYFVTSDNNYFVYGSCTTSVCLPLDNFVFDCNGSPYDNLCGSYEIFSSYLTTNQESGFVADEICLEVYGLDSTLGIRGVTSNTLCNGLPTSDSCEIVLDNETCNSCSQQPALDIDCSNTDLPNLSTVPGASELTGYLLFDAAQCSGAYFNNSTQT